MAFGPDGQWGYNGQDSAAATPQPFLNDSFFAVGQTRHLQAVYRELATEGSGLGQNTSQRVSLAFAP